MLNDHRNTILAVVLSAIVLIGWHTFFTAPALKRQQEEQRAQAQSQAATAPNAPSTSATPQPGSTVPQPGSSTPQPAPATQPLPTVSREAALATAPRIKIETPNISGSLSLKGGRIDDIALVRFRDTVDPVSPAVILFSPSGAPHPYYAEFGWVPTAGATTKVPDRDTLWRQEGAGPLTQTTPVTLVYDNGEGLIFRRTITVDERFLFTIKDDVQNTGNAPTTLYPFALISRHGLPQVSGYYILHEGLVGVLGDQGLQEYGYKKIDDEPKCEPTRSCKTYTVTNAWLGLTDKYWAATLLPNTDAKLTAKFSSNLVGNLRTYQADYLLDSQTVQPGATISANGRLFAGAKEVSAIDAYEKDLKLNRFELLIDWGWFHFITKPMFFVIDWLFKLFGNFGVAILLVTVLVKTIFFPLANKSYASMAKMKTVQPQLVALRERYPDDKMKQQQEMMEIYKREKINPVAGCLPILIQIPVFFALYKVLFITIEMRHAPFFGWIKDLSAPDPTNIFNLFGLLPFDPSHLPLLGPYLVLGIWPIIMGITMWVQMKLNPTPPDPTQKMIFDWMPLIFTFMLASFPAGLVIYWAWNNLLSVIQQSIIMQKNGAKIELFDNIKATFAKKPSDPTAPPATTKPTDKKAKAEAAGEKTIASTIAQDNAPVTDKKDDGATGEGAPATPKS
jgi:YidC/Oxa1 family membrane protein insertase